MVTAHYEKDEFDASMLLNMNTALLQTYFDILFGD